MRNSVIQVDRIMTANNSGNIRVKAQHECVQGEFFHSGYLAGKNNFAGARMVNICLYSSKTLFAMFPVLNIYKAMGGVFFLFKCRFLKRF